MNLGLLPATNGVHFCFLVFVGGGGQAQGPDYLEKIDPFVWVNRLIYVGVFIGLDIRGKLFWFLQYLIAIGRGFYVVY